jgi:hypothetical protein
MESLKSPKIAKKFICEKCVYCCSKESDFNKHLATAKHNKLIIDNTQLIEKSPEYICSICYKEYKSNVGLWKHKKKCTLPKENELHVNQEDSLVNKNIVELLIKENSEIKNCFLEIVKSNSELQKQNNEMQKKHNDLHEKFLEVCKNNNTTNITQTNSHNKTFNLQFFLNEQCKDAMNITDFVNSFDLQLSDLESVGELGYVEGITKIMVDKLNSMDIYKRPIHCSDAKREILYIKDHDKWEKEERNNPKLRYAIKTISFRNMKLANLWSDTYPESKDGDSRLNDTYMKLIKESTGGNGEIGDNENKIIRRIAKEILIEKNLKL